MLESGQGVVMLLSGQGVVVAAGAVPFDIIVVSDPPPVPTAKAAKMTLASAVLSFTPSGQQFLTPVTLVFAVSITPAAGNRLAVHRITHAAGNRLAVHRYNKETFEWEEKAGTRVLASGTVEVQA
ncbi:hypothetical protein T484DRAFT_1864826 [Baffinella frigidus]|nr:hypothetical protein T484DRAFT_1864826 [Cryptophyta sp. CCMP2293]